MSVNCVTASSNARMNKQKSDPQPASSPPGESKESKEQPEVAFELSLEDTLSQQTRGVAAKATKGTGGYNPYDAALPNTAAADRGGKADGKAPDAKRKPTDLRKLSEWIRLQRQVEALKKEPEPGSKKEPESK
jgi:hypothetical protein